MLYIGFTLNACLSWDLPPKTNPQWMMECMSWAFFGRCTQRSRPVAVRCLAMKDQRECLLDVLELLGNTGNFSDELGFKQHWNLFLLSSSFCQRKLIHAWIDQCEVAVKFWPKILMPRSSNLTAPSPSRGTWLVMSQQSDHQFWHTSTLVKYSWFDIYPLSLIFRNTDRRQRQGLCPSWSSLRDKFPCTPVLQHLQQESPLTFRLRICWFRSRYEPEKQFCHEMVIRSWFPHRDVLNDNRPSHPELDRSSFPRIHPFTWDDWSVRDKVYSRRSINSSSLSSSSVMKNCLFSIIFEKQALEQSLVNFSFIHTANFLVLRHQSE